MIVTCIAASNVKGMGERSASIRACRMVGELIAERVPAGAIVETVEMAEYDLRPCVMCGQCVKEGRCIYDSAFNAVFEKMKRSDALFMVVPHYAPIPSKLMMLFEKLQELGFLYYLAGKSGFPLVGKPVGIIAHGGQPESEETLTYYKNELLKPVANTLASVGVKIIGAGEDWPRGITFGIADMIRTEGKLLPDFTHDWDQIRSRVSPLVEAVIKTVA